MYLLFKPCIIPILPRKRAYFIPHFLRILLAVISLISLCLGTCSVSFPRLYVSWFPPCSLNTNPPASSFFIKSLCFNLSPPWLYYTYFMRICQGIVCAFYAHSFCQPLPSFWYRPGGNPAGGSAAFQAALQLGRATGASSRTQSSALRFDSPYDHQRKQRRRRGPWETQEPHHKKSLNSTTGDGYLNIPASRPWLINIIAGKND